MFKSTHVTVVLLQQEGTLIENRAAKNPDCCRFNLLHLTEFNL